VRTRTTILQTHTHQFMGTFGGPGNGDYRGELARACLVATCYAKHHQLQPSQILLRLDGEYGNAAVIAVVLRVGSRSSRAWSRLCSAGSARSAGGVGEPSRWSQYPPRISGVVRSLYDCPHLHLTPDGPPVRLIITTHPVTTTPHKIGKKRDGLIYELFVSTLAAPAFTAKDVLELYLHRGSFETVLADEDREQDPDRWCSHTPEATRILANHESMGLEPPLRTGTPFVPNAASYNGICVRQRIRASRRTCVRQRTRASRRATIRQRVGLWTTTVGTSIFYQRFSWVSISPTTRWHAALSSRAWALPTGTPTRARWLPTCVVCCADRRLSSLFAPSTVSRKPPDH
jgi:hypothetical protein